MSEQAEVNFLIQKVFIKDLSFEAPNTPAIFKPNWQPETNMELNTASNKLDDNTYEVELTVTVSAKNDNKSAFLAEVKQTGIFLLEGIADDQLNHALGSFCPSILYPYAQEAIRNLITRGGFPDLHLTPINFDALYMQKMQQEQTQTEDETQH
ncbi:protein-export chaperone SecB [Thiotrichales bacterium 19S3-7]|nr:protein-export chaperone SecB [Thiotrichales bacterium 19S3-7]MCF6801992.1 protein-export chaperone SecB [Thiotrichales bacterium 19S3-11]